MVSLVEKKHYSEEIFVLNIRYSCLTNCLVYIKYLRSVGLSHYNILSKIFLPMVTTKERQQR